MADTRYIESLESRSLFSASMVQSSSIDYAPTTLAGLAFNCKVLQGSFPFGSLGTFELHFNTNKQTCTISGGGIITSDGKYSYARTSANHAIGLLDKYEDAEQSFTITFTSAHSGLLFTNPKGAIDTRKIKFSF